MTERVSCQRLQVAANLKRFIEEEALPGSGVDAAAFWSGFDALVHDLAPKNAALLAERDRIDSGQGSPGANVLTAARTFVANGFSLMGTTGTVAFLAEHGIEATLVNKLHEGSPHMADAIRDGQVQLVINHAKWTAANALCESHGIKFRVVTEEDLFL